MLIDGNEYLDNQIINNNEELNLISEYHAKYYAYKLTQRHSADGINRLSQSLFDASVDLNPHQIVAA